MASHPFRLFILFTFSLSMRRVPFGMILKWFRQNLPRALRGVVTKGTMFLTNPFLFVLDFANHRTK